MKKFFLRLLALLILLLALLGAAYLFSAFFLSQALSQQLGTQVSVGQATFKWNTISIRNITVASPQNKLPALTIERTHLKAPLPHYLKKIILIDKIELNDCTLAVIFNNPLMTSNNWDAMTSAVNKSSASKKDTKYALISLLEFNRLTIRIVVPGMDTQTKFIPQLTFHNIKSSEGEVVRKITQIILFEMLFNAKQLFNLPLQILDPVKTLFQPFENLIPFSQNPQS